ncbi:phosphoesterase [Rhodococcus phage Trina]|uniref:Uncharacterized protein n=1 Tax=Rhodococcus phage Trina TaxID=2027905 RepID=A0A2D0ZM68_9CAUD|nr:phosphoesterase [Rhodococcus phage Trina]ASZ74905.1 hypothetical protein SEA_TRINA_91 [Rhodococcus phage Trina]
MIRDDCEIYVIGKGFVKPDELTCGNQVHTLDGLAPTVTEVQNVTSDWVTGRINSIDSGAHNVDLTDDARSLYYSDRHGLKFISWGEIYKHTADKRYMPTKYQPVLSYPDLQTPPVHKDSELEQIARMIAVHEYDRELFRSIADSATSLDALMLIDMLEFWCSVTPGKGWFERVSVKSRSHLIKDRYFLDELCRLAVLAGYTAAVTDYIPYQWMLKVSYESMPIPGSRPKNQKYYKIFHTGLMYNIDAGNKPILGRSKGRCFYLPTASILNQKGMK